ncbi:glycoside hydrolase family 43 protein [Paenibacillus sp. S150]|uniref:glycoside hydrolase family 43 protein n=1 Tax=Paenibacillus sp. S150 TaxID=2749826 RepID=UPI001C58435B|nr:glycoside hydrolase family 43 protein [Paenibacillus sp. S150]MBW4082773.1 family 43 glycosylhydrolase [Paenibacillus sp. S150]
MMDASLSSSQQIAYKNPVLPGFYPDPSITRRGDDYFLVCSSFEYFPGVPIFHSRDLVQWTQIGHVLDRISQLDLRGCSSSGGIYAPTIRYHDGLFYMITTNVSGIGNFFVTAADPAGPWSDPVKVPFGGIDPSLMFDADGKVYVTVQEGSGYDSHIIQYEIDAATGEALSEPAVVWTGDGGPWAEGPHLYAIDGLYYIMSASGGTGPEHREIIGRSREPYGPFEQLAHPILTHNGIGHPIQYLGHADLIEGPGGQWWAVFLGVRPGKEGFSVLGRETFLAPVGWTEDGWPMIDNNEGTVELDMTVGPIPLTGPELEQVPGFVTEMEPGSSPEPLAQITPEPVAEPISGEPVPPALPGLEPAGFRGSYDFDETELPFALTFVRNPAEGSWSLKERPGWLALYGQAAGPGDGGELAFVGRRQQHKEAEWSTLLELESPGEGEAAGLCVRMNEQAHYEICLAHKDGHAVIAAYLTVKGQTQLAAEVPAEAGRVYLKIAADPTEYGLFYSLDGRGWSKLAAGTAYALSPQAVEFNGFTGVVAGMYAAGNGKAALCPAYFDWLNYCGL